MTSLFVARSAAGPARDLARGTREQDWWDEHAEFIDALVADGFIALGGPLPDEGGAMIVLEELELAKRRGAVQRRAKRNHVYLSRSKITRASSDEATTQTKRAS